jgi:hypothetical protein
MLSKAMVLPRQNVALLENIASLVPTVPLVMDLQILLLQVSKTGKVVVAPAAMAILPIRKDL